MIVKITAPLHAAGHWRAHRDDAGARGSLDQQRVLQFDCNGRARTRVLMRIDAGWWVRLHASKCRKAHKGRSTTSEQYLILLIAPLYYLPRCAAMTRIVRRGRLASGVDFALFRGATIAPDRERGGANATLGRERDRPDRQYAAR